MKENFKFVIILPTCLFFCLLLLIIGSLDVEFATYLGLISFSGLLRKIRKLMKCYLSNARRKFMYNLKC